MSFKRAAGLLACLAVWLTPLSRGQQTSAPANSDAAAQTESSGKTAPEAPSRKSEDEKATEKKEQSQRALSVLPMFGVTSRQDAPPLTPKEKFHLFTKSAFDPVTIGVVGLQAAISQGENEFPGYGQGAQGYGKRFGASLADEVSSGFWSNYFYPVLLKEDPRYFRLGNGNFKHRLFYSVKQEFVCHKDNGGRDFHYSNVLGAFTSGTISNLYYPGNTLIRTIPATATSPAIPVYEDDRGVVLTLSRATIALGYGAVGGLFSEFWPDIESRLHRRRKSAGALPAEYQ